MSSLRSKTHTLSQSSNSSDNYICLNVQQLQQRPLRRLVTCCMLTLTLRELPQWSKAVLLRMISIFPGSCPGFLVDFFFLISLFYFRIADTACVCSDLSGLKYCYAGDVTQNVWTHVSPSPSSLPLSKDTLISTYLIDRIFLFSINLFLSLYFHQVLLESYSILYMCVESEKIVIRIWSWTLSVHFICSDCLLVDCLYICWNFVVDCVFWSGRQKAYGCYPFQKVVRHIFIHVNIIFYIWIVGLFNELQYNAMYFYIVSSFLFKDRDYFISC